MIENKSKSEMSEEEIAQANARVIQHFKDTLKFKPLEYWRSLEKENLMEFKNAAIPVLEEMLDDEMMQNPSTANQFEKLILYATTESVNLVKNNAYNYSDYLINMGAVKKEKDKYVFVKPIGHWKRLISNYEFICNTISVSKEYKQKIHNTKSNLIRGAAEENYYYYKYLHAILKSYGEVSEELIWNVEGYHDYGIYDIEIFNVVLAYYKGIFDLIVRPTALFNYELLECEAATKAAYNYEVLDLMHPSAWLIGLELPEIYQLSYEEACSNKHEYELILQLIWNLDDVYYVIVTNKDSYKLYEKALLIKIDENEADLEFISKILTKFQDNYESVIHYLSQTKEINFQVMCEFLHSHLFRIIKVAEDFALSSDTVKDYEKHNKVRFETLLSVVKSYKKCFNAILHNIDYLYEREPELISKTKEVYDYYKTLIVELDESARILSGKKETSKLKKEVVKTEKKEKTIEKKVKKSTVKKEKTSRFVAAPIPEIKEDPIEIADKDVLNAFDLLSKISKGQKYETAKKAYDIVHADKGRDASMNQFEVLLLSDEDRSFHAGNIVKHHYEKANKQNKVYGTLGTCLQSIQTGMKTLKSKQPTKAGKTMGLIGAVVSILVMLFVLNSSMTAFLWSADAEELVGALAIIIIAVIGLFTGGIVGGVIGLFGGALVMVLVSSMIGIAKIMKFVCVILFVILALACLIMGFSNSETEEDRKLRETLSVDYKKALAHINHILDALTNREGDYESISLYYENVKQQFEQNKVE